MLISPPFLVDRQANETDEAWIARCMAGGEPGQGAFPLSFNLGWHGGMHLNAPLSGTQAEPVRAIADGTVVFVRQPVARPAGALPPDHPQAYRGGWTDNGVVVIRHETEIGDGANGTVTFFSITMHLSEVDAAVRSNAVIYRKARLGVAGQIYGDATRKIHFEIVCDDTHLARLAGRASGELNLTADGRTDALYGEVYCHVPSGAQIFAQRPVPQSAQAMMQPPTPQGQRTAPALQPLQAAYTTTEDLVFGLRPAAGDGPAAQRGHVYVTTYHLDGTAEGAALSEADGEYTLYTAAKTISESYPAATRPIHSAVYELLRFGRVVGPDALTPADVPHWRQVRYPGGQGWINLNATGIHKFSDADFPHWRQWSLVDDGADGDSRCDSATIKGWLDTDGDGKVLPAEASTRLAAANVAPRLARAICKFPTEWDAATIDARWGWLKTSSDENPTPLSAEDFETLRAHITALAFWPGGVGIDATHWHWQPREFIRHFRTCGWLSLNELTQLLPRRHGAQNSLATIRWATANGRFSPYTTELNKTFRKYLILGPTRQIHFLAQTYIETAMWQTMEEFGKAHQQRKNGVLYWPAPMMQYYTAFYGRGIMQLTWAGNYKAYGEFRSFPDVGAGHTYVDTRITHTTRHHPGDPSGGQATIQWFPRYDPDDIATQAHNACDSGGHYWVSKAIGGGQSNINRVSDRGVDTAAVGRASVLVNGGGYGYAERQAYAPFIERFRADDTRTDATRSFVATRGTRNHNIYVDFTPQRP